MLHFRKPWLRTKNVKKSESSFFGTPSSTSDFSDPIRLGTSDLAYLTSDNQYVMILHYPWLRVKSRTKKVKKLIFWNFQVQVIS